MRRTILSAAAVMVLAGWRLANPPVALAIPGDPCGTICGPPGCTDFEWTCAGCEGQWWCTTETTLNCAGHSIDATYFCGGSS